MANKKLYMYLSDYKKYFFWLCFFSLFYIFIFLRLPYFGTPLNHDEVDTAYNVFQVMNGQGFYSTDWNNKPPLIHLFYTLNAAMFGELDIFSMRAFGLLYGMATLAVFYVLSRTLLKKSWLALFASLIFGVFFSSPALQGEYNNTENFFLFFIILSYYFCLKGVRFFPWSYLCMGLAFLLKPTTAFSLLPIVFYTHRELVKPSGWKPAFLQVLKHIGVFLLPFLFIVIFFLTQGVFWDFIDWVFWKNFTHVRLGQASSSVFLENFLPIWEKTFIFWIAGSVGCVAMFFQRDARYRIIIGWIFTATLSVVTGGWFFPHYFLEMTAPVTLAGSVGLLLLYNALKKIPWRGIILSPFFLFIIFLIVNINFRQTFFDWQKYILYLAGDRQLLIPPQHQMYYDAGRYLQNRLREYEAMFVWGGSPELYFWARQTAPLKDIWNYHYLNDDLQFPTLRGWFSDYEKSREKLLRFFEVMRPRYIALSTDFLVSSKEYQVFPEFFDWVFRHYRLEKIFRDIWIYAYGTEDEKEVRAYFVRNLTEDFISEFDLKPSGNPDRIIAVEGVSKPLRQATLFLSNARLTAPFLGFERPLLLKNEENGTVLLYFEFPYEIFSEPYVINFEYIDGTSWSQPLYEYQYKNSKKTQPQEWRIFVTDDEESDVLGLANEMPSGVKDVVLRVENFFVPIASVDIMVADHKWHGPMNGIYSPVVLKQKYNEATLVFEPRNFRGGESMNITLYFVDGRSENVYISLP